MPGFFFSCSQAVARSSGFAQTQFPLWVLSIEEHRALIYDDFIENDYHYW
jgi:hypothetical protein